MVEDSPKVAVLEHLTGPSRGTVSWLGDVELSAVLDESRVLQLVASADQAAKDAIAYIKRVEGRFEVSAAHNQTIWVNGRQVQKAYLDNHDMIEFGDAGPISRFCICGSRQPIEGSFPGIFRDALGYLRNSRQPVADRISNVLGLTLRRFVTETTLVFRFLVIIAIILLAALAYQQWRISNILKEQVLSADLLMEEFARTIARNRQEAVTPSEIESLRLELGQRIETTTDRLTALEKRSRAAARIIRENTESVFLIQAAYGFRHKETGQFLRQLVGDDGTPLILPNGLMALTLEGNGPIAERQFISTAFAVRERGVLVTNRHVAMPWEQDAILSTMLAQGLEPNLLKLIAFQPGENRPMPAAVLSSSEKDDLALLQVEPGDSKFPTLTLSKRPSNPGEEIVVMGYPTGLRSLLAQAGQEFVEKLQDSGETGFWSIAEQLAEAGKIIPLASMGIIGRVGEDVLVYDAETTHGGSGGPVLDLSGAVVAVNTAILPEYGGSNLGIPVAKIDRLIRQANLNN